MRSVLFGIVALGTLAAAPAMADITITLGGGWDAVIRDERNVSLEVESIGEDVLVLRKIANFFKVDHNGNPLPQNIIFVQTADDADTVPRIIITEEFVTNSTEADWSGFQMRLGPAGTFNPELSADFSIDPFTTTVYSDDNHVVTYGGGTVFAGDVWTPGVTSGGLVIDIDLSDESPVKLIFREIPLVPAPGALALLGLAGLLARRRRSR